MGGDTQPAGFNHLSIVGGHAAKIAGLPPIHKDLFDRLLVAQARFEPMILSTDDELLSGYRGGAPSSWDVIGPKCSPSRILTSNLPLLPTRRRVGIESEGVGTKLPAQVSRYILAH
jgi:hypothetical protein